MPPYKVQTPLKRNGKFYAEGDPITLTANQAQPLLDAGVVRADAQDRPAQNEEENQADGPANQGGSDAPQDRQDGQRKRGKRA